MNVLTIVGRLTRDPELRTTNNGTQVCNFSVAVNGRGKDADTTFFRCKAFNRVAEIVDEYCTKGREICVSGPIECRKYDDKEGNPRESWEVLVNNVTLIGGVRDDAPAKAQTPNTGGNDDDFDPFDD